MLVRFLLVPLAALLCALAAACNGDSPSPTPEPTPTVDRPTVAASTPVPAPPWTDSPHAEQSTLPTQDTTTGPSTTSAPAPTTPPDTTQPPATPTQALPLNAIVSVQDNSFGPAVVTIPAGGTVTWMFDGGVAHEITGPFAHVIQQPGETFSFTFATPGIYDYRCDIHTIPGTRARMTGRVVVQ